IPAFYLLLRDIYGKAAAILSAAALAMMPLHVGLGASSLSEAGFLFYIVAAIWALTRALATSTTRIIPLALFVGSYVLAEMTRYESWPLIPLFIGWLYLRSRSVIATAIVGALLAAFPLAWSVANYRHTGDFLYGIHAAAHPPEGGGRIGTLNAIVMLTALVRRQLGSTIALAAVAGLLLESYRSFLRSLSGERSAYAILVTVVWIINFNGAMTMGPALFDRHLLLGFVLMLPLAALSYLAIAGSSRMSLAGGTIIFAASLALAYVPTDPHTFVSGTKPTEIIELAKWLRTSRYRDCPIISTQLDWQPSYLPLYAARDTDPRGIEHRYFMVSAFSEDEWIRDFLKQSRSALLVTEPADAGDREHLERVLGHNLTLGTPVHVSGHLQVYDISNDLGGSAR
ncbi:MAG TPA: hypothetical protein VMT64_04755, partial [Candidatus Binataceae bacterium]|nr:hypothetical protein [Candidatus Binataceae bacterium]